MLNELHKRYAKQDLVIIGVSTDEDGPDAVRTFMKEVPMIYPVYMATEGIADRFGGVWALPTSYFFDRKGNKVDQSVGLQTREYFETRIQRIL